jgi:hypothetical protein
MDIPSGAKPTSPQQAPFTNRIKTFLLNLTGRLVTIHLTRETALIPLTNNLDTSPTSTQTEQASYAAMPNARSLLYTGSYTNTAIADNRSRQAAVAQQEAITKQARQRGMV